MIKIAHINEIETIKHLPLEVINAVSEIVAILDNNYGINRDIEHGLGGYILIAENEKDVEEIRKIVDLEDNLPEYVDLIYSI